MWKMPVKSFIGWKTMPSGARVVILMGPMGCGKTTVGRLLAQRLHWPFFDGDDFHPEDNVEKMRAGIALSDEDRRSWLENLRDHIQGCLRENTNAVLACSALKRSYRDTLGVDQSAVRTVYLKGSFQLLRQRIDRRRHPYMNKDLLKSQFDILEEPQDGLTVDIQDTPEAIVQTIVDALAKSGISEGFVKGKGNRSCSNNESD